MAENTQPCEPIARRSATNALLVVGFAYVSAIVTFGVAAQFEHEWGELAMQILAGLCVPPAVLFFITQGAVSRGHAAGWAMLLTALSGGLLTLLVVLGMMSLLSQVGRMVTTDDMDTWRFPWDWGSMLSWITVAILLSCHVRAWLFLGRWSACPMTSQPESSAPPDLSWAAWNQQPTERSDSENPRI